MLGKGGNLETSHATLMKIWGMEVSPKVKHFLWILFSNTLLTQALLNHCHMLEDAHYP